MRDQGPRLSVRFAAVFVAFLCALLIVEGLSRLVFAYQDELYGNAFLSNLVRGEMVLDPYEIASPTIGEHWKLRAGYPFSDTSESQYRINQDGMRGPEIDKSHSRIRILTLGDSVTFGLNSVTYPRILEGALDEAGVSVEVINGGVEGYFPRNLLYEIDRYVSFHPDVVTIFIGWNALYSPILWLGKYEQTFRTLWFIRNLKRSIYRQFKGERAYATEMLARTPLPVVHSSEVMYADKYSPNFLGKIEKIIDRFQAKGSRVFLLTLPGLFASDESLSLKALKIGHMPAFTVNPYVLAKITQRYNQSLRNLAARRGLGLIDLASWSERNLSPREDFFLDSVHLTPEGLIRIGSYIAEQIKPALGKEQKP